MTKRKVCPKCREPLDDGRYVIYDQHYSCAFPETIKTCICRPAPSKGQTHSPACIWHAKHCDEHQNCGHVDTTSGRTTEGAE